jgi:very-short-patch-repair endonuclease
MTHHYNKSSEKQIRRELRKNQTLGEKILWNYLRNRKLLKCKFRRQYSVDKFVIDFYCSELKLAIEFDGFVHDEPAKKEHDIFRQKYLEGFGINFLRVNEKDLFGNSENAFKKIENEIALIREKKKTSP